MPQPFIAFAMKSIFKAWCRWKGQPHLPDLLNGYTACDPPAVLATTDSRIQPLPLHGSSALWSYHLHFKHHYPILQVILTKRSVLCMSQWSVPWQECPFSVSIPRLLLVAFANMETLLFIRLLEQGSKPHKEGRSSLYLLPLH